MQGKNSNHNEKKNIKIVDKRFWAQKNISPEEIGKEVEGFDERKLFPSYVAELEDKLKRSEQQLTEYISAYKGLKNQQNSFMKRMEKLKENEVEEYKIKLLGRIIEIIDDLERAISAYSRYKDSDSLYKGLELIHQQMIKLLNSENIELIEIKDDNLDPKFVEPIAIEPTDDKEKDNKIAEQVLPGYIFKDKVIRAAKVKIYKYKDETSKN